MRSNTEKVSDQNTSPWGFRFLDSNSTEVVKMKSPFDRNEAIVVFLKDLLRFDGEVLSGSNPPCHLDRKQIREGTLMQVKKFCVPLQQESQNDKST